MTSLTDGWTEQDKQQIEQVFILTGGELESDAWVPRDETGAEWTFHFWYAFPPEYAECEFNYTASDYRTIVRDQMFGESPAILVDVDNETWRKVATFQSSGETECPWRNDPDTRVVVGEACSLCEGDIGEDHGYVYIGDGWAEVVYRRDEVDIDIDDMLDGYLTCSLWSSIGDDGEPLDKTFATGGIAGESIRAAREVCESFVESAGHDLYGMESAQAGHDLWLTRNRHGAGFWDRGLGARGDRLTELAYAIGESDAYVGDDGQVYFS